MSKGKVKYFNDTKGWGFLSGDGSEQEIYVHYSAIVMKGFRTLKEGQRVLFDAIDTGRGLRASNVVLAK